MCIRDRLKFIHLFKNLWQNLWQLFENSKVLQKRKLQLRYLSDSLLVMFWPVCQLPKKSQGVLPTEAIRADSGSGVLREEAASPLPISKGVQGFPSGVRRGTPAAQRFFCTLTFPGSFFCLVIKDIQLQKSLKLSARGGGLRHPPWGARNYIVINCSSGGFNPPYPPINSLPDID